MMGQTSGLEKSAKCTAALATAYLIAKFGADDDTLSQATASTEELVGVFQHTTSAAGEEVRVMLTGISRVVLGGTVTRGAYLTADANGKAVAAAPGAGVNAYVVGQAMASGVAGDIIPVLLKQGRIQG
ncbi:MAG: capsid cement protein [Thermodesulfobacteriota bacterium]